MLKNIATVFGVVLLAIGVLGFVPALNPDNHLLGIFHVDTLHNIIHIASGLVALLAGLSSYGASRMYFQVFGVIYGAVALLGVFAGDNDVLGLVANNMADTLLHIAIAAAALSLGFGNIVKEEVHQ